jgi:hypothetical protein
MASLDPSVLFDHALSRLHETDVEYKSGKTDGLSNHGPMVLDSLVALGMPARIEPFLTRYLPRLRPLPQRDGTLPRLGDPQTARAWIDHYEAKLSDGDWRRVVEDELPALLPGAAAAAAHGFLRTAHAIRALSREDTPVRRRELAFGLASWAARYQALPGVPGARAEAGLDVARALARVPLVPQAERHDVSLIVDRVEVVSRLAGFADAIESVDLDAMSFGDSVGTLASVGARLSLVTPSESFVFLHATTAPSALRFLHGVVSPDLERRALGAIFQTVAAFYAGYSDPSTNLGALTPEALPVSSATVATVRTLVGQSYDDHDIKFADAVLREWGNQERPGLLEAAVARLDRGTSSPG